MSFKSLWITGLLGLVHQSGTLTGRWVGTHAGQPLHLEFYGDTMLVVNDQHALNYRLTPDSLVAVGDTTVQARYWFSMGRLLLETPAGAVLTMAAQNALARPLTGRWLGELGTPDGAEAELRIAAGGAARWRKIPSGAWMEGEWERQTRIISFTWARDSTDWIGHYDVDGNAIVFERTVPESRPTIFVRVFRP
ncbi:MAG TPA: hypothetical protein VD793_10430 [Gemmatimonadales bacterium]|nr:hypothetical protein [Gemmatimonadales bacterium]